MSLTAFSACAHPSWQAVMIALDPTQNAKLPRDVLLESCIQALVLPVNGNFPRHVYDIL